MLVRMALRGACVIVGCFGLIRGLYADDGVEFRPTADRPAQAAPMSQAPTPPKPKPRPPKPKLDGEGVEFEGLFSVVPRVGVDVPFVSTGETSPEFQTLDAMFTELVTEQQVPGVSVAIVKDGRLVYARGFGYADIKQQQPAQPDSFYRIASLSKALTATGILKLVDQGRITLDQSVFELLELEPYLLDGAQLDPRMKSITIRHCLQHTAGWDRDATYDPIFRQPWICEQLGLALPLQADDMVRFQFGRPLDFDPDQKYRYSNLGYSVLGRVIEKVSGRNYAEFMHAEVFEPLGMQDIRLGKELVEGRGEREVVYYTPRPQSVASVVPPRIGDKVTLQYGGWSLSTMDSAAGWTSTATELVKFVASFEGTGHPVLSPAAVTEMFACPSPPIGHDRNGKPELSYYGCGWQVRNYTDGGFNASHTGLFTPGTSTWMVRRRDGVSWVVLCNQDRTKSKNHPSTWLQNRMHQAVDEIASWPEKNLFASDGRAEPSTATVE